MPRIGRQMLYRQEAVSKTVCDMAWKAHLRLTSRFRKRVARGKAKPKVATAIARELTGFIWAMPGRCRRHLCSGAAITSVRSAASWPGGEPSKTFMDISTTDPSVPRARPLRDEPQSGRYPTRGYRQRQPSPARGAADQMDLKNEEHGKCVLSQELTIGEVGSGLPS